MGNLFGVETRTVLIATVKAGTIVCDAQGRNPGSAIMVVNADDHQFQYSPAGPRREVFGYYMGTGEAITQWNHPVTIAI